MSLDDLLEKVKKRTIGLAPPIFRKNAYLFSGKKGIEIGGPSGFFTRGQFLPVYSLANQIDGVNFSTHTVWENTIAAGRTYSYAPGKVGHQYILEASELVGISDGHYDFLVACHSLEHCANTIKTVLEWKRVVRKGGALLIVVPHRATTFDWKRPVTTFAHLLSDYETAVDETDLTHLEEILSLHDIEKDAGVTDATYMRERSLKNYENRCLHHHVFDEALLRELFQFVGIAPLFTTIYKDFHTIILGQK